MNNSTANELGLGDALVQELKIGNMSKQTEECSGSRRDGGNFWFKMKKDQLFRSKFILKLAYIASFLTLGWREGQFGPTFPDLLNITNTTLERGSLFFTMNSVGYLLGSMLIGFLFDKRLLDRNLLMFLIIAGYGTIFVIIPWCGIYEVMVTVFIVKGSFAGGLDTCGNAGLVTTWGSEGGAYFSALHFALAAGAILSPLVTAPYVMSPSDDVPMRTFTNNVNSTNITDTLIDINRKRYNISNLNSTRNSLEDRSSMIYIPYTVTAGLCFMTSLPFIVFCGISLMKKIDSKTSEIERGKKKNTDRRLRILALMNILIYIALYVAIEKSFICFLTSFISSQLSWPIADGSYLTSGFWALYAAGRFLAIFLVRCVSPAKILFVFNSMLLLSLLGFYLTSIYNVTYGIWIFTLFTGFSLSLTFPIIVMWMESKFLRVTGKVASMFLVAAS